MPFWYFSAGHSPTSQDLQHLTTDQVKMRSAILSLVALASTASAHYTFPELVVNGKATGQWTYVRKTTNYQSNGTFPPSSSPLPMLTPPHRPRNRHLLPPNPVLRALPRHRQPNLHRLRRRHPRLHRANLRLAPRPAPILHGARPRG
jgi:hypothetical protein